MPLSVVVLPAPFAPIKQTSSPCSTPRSMPLTAWMPPYATCRRLNSSSGRADTRSSLQVERDLAAEIGGDDLGVILHFRRRPLRDLAAVVEMLREVVGALGDADIAQELVGALLDRRFLGERRLVAQHRAEHSGLGAHVAPDHDVLQRGEVLEQPDVLE